MAGSRIRGALKRVDDRLWRSAFGEADYLQLRPPVGQRLGMLARLPFSAGRDPHPEPVFVAGCPRSGTTILFEILRRSPRLGHLGQESHWIWERLRRPLRPGSDDQSLDADDVDGRYAAFVKACYRSAFGSRRFVDKCPTHALRIGAIRAVFPDATIVAIRRNGPDTVSSLIDTWLDPDRFRGFEVPETLAIEGYDRPRWVHLLEPGWRSVANAPIETVCAHQWVKTNEALLEARGAVPPERWVEVRHEDLVEAPVATTRALFERLGLPLEPPVTDFVGALDENPVNTRTAPGVGKWRRRHPERVARILPELAATMARLGYEVPSEESS